MFINLWFTVSPIIITIVTFLSSSDKTQEAIYETRMRGEMFERPQLSCAAI